jgi:hypothetical protein
METPSNPNLNDAILCQDKRWLHTDADNIPLEEFIELLPPIRFYDDVNQNVKEAFQVVHKLMIHSYYEYLFFDVAVTKALHIFEMALKLRYRELNNDEWKKNDSLKNLIEWFRKRNFFEREDEKFFDHVRNTRNYLSHPEKHHFKGMTSSHWIRTAVDLINDLYEDIELRKQRRILTDQARHEIDLFLKNGGKLILKGVPELVYACGHILINNKVKPTNVHFTLLKIQDSATAGPKQPILIQCKLDQLNFGATKFVLNNLDVDELFFTKDLDPDEFHKVERYKAEKTTDVEIIKQHSFYLFDSYKYILGIWRAVRYT